MDIKSCVAIEVKKNDKSFFFYMPADSSFGDAIDASHSIYYEVIDMARKAAEKEKPNKDSGDE